MNTIIEEKTCDQCAAKSAYIAPEVEVEWVSSSRSFMQSSEVVNLTENPEPL